MYLSAYMWVRLVKSTERARKVHAGDLHVYELVISLGALLFRTDVVLQLNSLMKRDFLFQSFATVWIKTDLWLVPRLDNKKITNKNI